MAGFINRDPDYSDLDLDFTLNTSTGDVAIKTGADAIKRSVRNLIFTNYYERKFKTYLGSGVTGLLFELDNPFVSVYLQDAITDCINNFEPRVKLQTVAVKSDPDNNGFNVTLSYIILNKNLPVTTGLFLERIR